MGKDRDHWHFPNLNNASNAGAPAVAKQTPNPMGFPTYAHPCGFLQLNSALMPPSHPTGFASGQKRFMVFDWNGDRTKLVYSSFGSQFPHPYPTTNDLPASKETNVSNGCANNENVNEEMHEDTEEIAALLYSSDSDDDHEEEDEASTGHYSQFGTTTGNFNHEEEEVASSAVLPPPAKRRRTNSEYDPSLADMASSTHHIGNDGMNKVKMETIQETVGVLRRIIPGAKGKDAVAVLDKAISYLKSIAQAWVKEPSEAESV